ncbi:hypothetical protein M2103_001888 [Ereboglobus sp. PH5-5]|uniref:hypothetical protein n=1 Tax=unclassified Ereboglobus TaxID=2626932 RepID=UPI002406EBDB|nr:MULTISPECIES: hypothetical protein [unclassified Ereboglobus]MDF9828378.1 hypothetical protein [Ereboglobus sp. PH5-10]MDF9833656.1 hypothetical protein [Ereboglobus sp. PH5-5]
MKPHLLPHYALLAFTFLWAFMTTVLTAAPAGRLTAIYHDIECEFSPGQETLAQELARRLNQYHHETPASTVAEETESKEPLSPAEMRAHRDDYLRHIASQLNLKKPTDWQEECYDEFLKNYEATMRGYAEMRNFPTFIKTCGRITIWNRPELMRRLEAGEKISGMSYDPVAKKVGAKFSFFSETQKNMETLSVERDSLRAEYQLLLDGDSDHVSYRGRVTTKKRNASPAKTSPSKTKNTASKENTGWFPVIIPDVDVDAPVHELAAKLWNESFIKLFEGVESIRIPLVDYRIAKIVLHETAEIGIIDHYYRKSDRRWFCDGVANYISWRVVRDMHGESIATSVYDVRSQLTRYDNLRAKIDLRKWPVAAKQTEKDRKSRLNSANYTFATQAVFLMNQKAGNDILPRLFAEIGKTPIRKVSMKTVESAWKKLTNGNLSAILAEAVGQPNPKNESTRP